MGLNLIITKDWVLLVALTKPWIEYGKEKLFWEPWSYLDFFSLPILQKTWPETSNLDSKVYSKDLKSHLTKLTQMK